MLATVMKVQLFVLTMLFLTVSFALADESYEPYLQETAGYCRKNPPWNRDGWSEARWKENCPEEYASWKKKRDASERDPYDYGFPGDPNPIPCDSSDWAKIDAEYRAKKSMSEKRRLEKWNRRRYEEEWQKLARKYYEEWEKSCEQERKRKEARKKEYKNEEHLTSTTEKSLTINDCSSVVKDDVLSPISP